MSSIRPEVTVQFATARSGVPHASALRKWATRAFDEALSFARADKRDAAGTDIAIRIVSAAESRRLNRTWRGKDKPTNVLSFPLHSHSLPRSSRGPLQRVRAPAAFAHPAQQRAGRGQTQAASTPLGDLAICAPVVAREAREQGKSPHAHWAHMVVHGVLHLLGYDHEIDRDAAIMEAREVAILMHFGYANPYG